MSRRYSSHIEKLAVDALTKAKAKKFKVDPGAVAEALGAEVVEIQDDSSSSGMVVRQGARIIIGVNVRHPQNRRPRWTREIRPTMDGSKPANGQDPGPVGF